MRVLTSKREFVEAMRDKPIRISANDEIQEAATEIAKTYWMMSWNWEEIEGILYDREYPEKIIDKAIKEAQEYASENLNNGPFATFGRGQFLKLRSGKIVKLVSCTDKYCKVADKEDTYDVKASEINMKASKRLTKAYKLRLQANHFFVVAQEKKYQTPKELDLSETQVTPEIDETYQTKFVKKTPTELVEKSPEIGDVEPLHSSVNTIINNIDGLRALKDELQAKIKEVRDTELKPLQEQFKQLSKEEQAELRNVFLVAGEIQEGLKGINNTIFGDYENQIVSLQNKLVEIPKKPGVVEELNKLKNILVENHKDISEAVFGALEEYMESTSTIERTVEHTLAKFPYRKTPRKKSSYTLDGQAFDKLKDFFKGIWNKVKDISKNLYDKVMPKAEESIAAIEDTLNKIGKKEANNKLRVALKDLVNDDDPLFMEANDTSYEAMTGMSQLAKQLTDVMPSLITMRDKVKKESDVFSEGELESIARYSRSMLDNLKNLKALF